MEKLIVISSPERVDREHSLINRLFEEGMALFHVRKPHLTLKETKLLLDNIAEEHYGKIVLHQHHVLTTDYPVRRLHYPERDRPELKAAAGFLYSTSVHAPEDIRGLDSLFRYTFYGPVFGSISKENYGTGNRIADIKAWKKKNTRVIALGGICEDNCSIPFRYGYDGIAVLGAVWQSGDPVGALKKIQQCITTAL